LAIGACMTINMTMVVGRSTQDLQPRSAGKHLAPAPMSAGRGRPRPQRVRILAAHLLRAWTPAVRTFLGELRETLPAVRSVLTGYGSGGSAEMHPVRAQTKRPS
jgi:hypothetical protein